MKKRRIEFAFSGLCLFVPTDDSPRRMTVLLPQTPLDANGGPYVPPHTAKLRYQGETKILGAHEVSFPEVSRRKVSSGLHKGVIDLSSIHHKKVRPSELGSEPLALRARVLLPAGEFEHHGKTKKWKIGTVTQCEMTDVVVWEIDDLDKKEDVVMQITNFAGKNPEKIRIKPDWDNVVRISLEHYCGCETEVECDLGEYRTPHFRAYYKLLIDGASLPLPILEDCPPSRIDIRPDSEGRYSLSTYEDAEPRTTIYTCMVAGAQPGP